MQEITCERGYICLLQYFFRNNQLILAHHDEGDSPPLVALTPDSHSFFSLELSILIRNFCFPYYLLYHFIFKKISKERRDQRKMEEPLSFPPFPRNFPIDYLLLERYAHSDYFFQPSRLDTDQFWVTSILLPPSPCIWSVKRSASGQTHSCQGHITSYDLFQSSNRIS